MRIMVGLKERFVQVLDQFWEWIIDLPEPIAIAVVALAVGTLLSLWTLALLYFIWHATWQALRWMGKV